MSDRVLPDWIDTYLEYTDNTEPPYMFKQWVAISTVGSLLQRKCQLNWGDFEVFFPNMYIVLVAPPAKAMKGTAIRPGLDFLKEVGINLAADVTTKEALIHALSTATDSGIGDIEEGIHFEHSNLVIVAPELTVFTSYQNSDLMTYLIDWYDCKTPWTYDTKHQGTDTIEGIWVALLGGSTPDLIRESMPTTIGVGGGLTSRIIFVYEEHKEKIVIIPSLTHAQRVLKEKLKDDANRIYAMHGQFKYTKEFLEHYTEWRIKGEENPPFADRCLEGYCGRRHVHLLKMSMILSASRNSDMKITGGDFDRAVKILVKTELKMPLVFSGVGTNPHAAVQTRIMRYIANNKEVDFYEIIRSFRMDAEPIVIEKILMSLDKSGYCSIAFVGPKENRKPIVTYEEG